MNQLSLLGSQDQRDSAVSARPNQLRDYQVKISQQALSCLAQRKSVLSVAATGTGKTRIAAAVVQSFPGRVLWIAHRIELVSQAIQALEHVLGEQVDVELPGLYSGSRRVIVASKDTVRTKSRLDRLKNFGTIDLIVIDECHHSEAISYRTITDAYPGALRFGLSATPQRMDNRKLSLFDVQTTPYDICTATAASYLVPISACRVNVASVDLSGVRTVAGDLDRGQLNDIMRSEENLHAVAKAILDRKADLPGLLFSTSVDVAERTCEIINRYSPGLARFVSGKTPDNERRELFANLGRTYQVLANYGIATEGTDLVCIRSVFMQRPTKSTTLFQQMLGRGLRPLPGTVDGFGDSASRAAAIQASGKPRCLVVDFTGNTGRHSVQTAVDVLAEGADQEAVRKVKERLQKGQVLDVAGAIAEEIQAAQERKVRKATRDLGRLARAAIVGKVQLTSRDVRLIGLGGIPTGTEQASIWSGPPLPAQVSELSRLGIATAGLDTAGQARKAIATARDRVYLATTKQVAFIAKHHPDLARPDLTKTKASYIIGRIIHGWRRK